MKSKTRLSMTVAFVVAILFAGVMLQATISEVPTGTWRAAGPMSSARRGASASLLNDGRVLVAGGVDEVGAALATADVFGGAGLFTGAQSMLLARTRHAAVTLPGGRVLVIGGETGFGATSEIEIYNPQENQWTVAGTLLAARSGHTATLLPSGRVLIVGGEGPSAPGGVVEVFDPAGGGSVQVGALQTPRTQHVAVTLADGRVLIAGGQDPYGITLNSTEIFDLVEGVTAGPLMAEARAEATATALVNGDVLIAGGRNGSDLSSAEVYSKASGAFSAAPAMATARSGHAAFMLPGNNGVLIVGGSAPTAELFLPQARQFVSTGAPAASGAGAVGAPLSQDGLLLLAGPGSASELYGFATLKTNQLDYQPGTPVVITGAGWKPGETVQLNMVEEPLLDVHSLEPVVADEWGHIFTNQWAPDTGDLGIRFYLTAKGESSEAQVTFTDAIPPADTTTATRIHRNDDHGLDVQNKTIPFGSTIHDLVMVSSAEATPTGSVTLKFFTNDECSGTQAFSATLQLSGGAVDAVGFAQGPLSPGGYSFLASYDGTVPGVFPAFRASVGSCEKVTVDKATSTTVTEIHANGNHADVQGSTLALGSIIHDQAKVSGSAGTPTGSVSFAFYTNGVCSGSPASSPAFPLSNIGGNGVVDAVSFAQGPLGAGNYSFLATYSGDANYNGSPGACETVTVAKGNATTRTAIHANGNETTDAQGSTLALGATIHDQATVSGNGVVVPTGSVTFDYFTNGVCSGSPASSPAFPLSNIGGNGVVDAVSFAQGPLGAGSYSFLASYGGDDNYKPSVGVCETVTVAKGDTTTRTAIHANGNETTDAQGSTLALGATIHDQATVSGSGAGAPTGSASFAFYNNGMCSGTVASSGVAALVGGVADAAGFGQGPLGAGSYSFLASYGGDDNYKPSVGVCETVTVDKANTATSTAIHVNGGNETDVQGSTLALGASIHDQATVSGSGMGAPTGSVSFAFYNNGACTGTPVTGAAALAGGVAHAAGFGQGPLGAGSYSFLASYGGDDNYKPSVGVCETVTVDKANTATSTAIHVNGGNETDVQGSTLALGASIHDQATVSGSGMGAPTGSVSFAFYNNGACTGTPVTGAAALAGGVAHAVGFGQGPLGAGSYSFLASYGGDDNYKPSVGVCETVTVDKANTATSTAIHVNGGNETDVQGSTLALGASIHDQATVSGSGMGAPTGSVSFAFYNNGACTGTPVTGAAALAGGVAHAVGFGQGPLGAGSYSFLASYGGDDNYKPSVGVCETVTVDKANTATSTAIHVNGGNETDVQGSTLALGASIHDQATVSGSGMGAPTGSVSFAFYNNGACTGTPVTGAAALAGGVAHAVGFGQGPLGAGSYSFLASYGGDDNYKPSVGVCETVTVDKANTATSTAIHVNGGNETDVQGSTLALGSSIHDQAAVSGSGAGTPTGTVTFAFYKNNTCTGTPADVSGAIALAGGVADATAFAQSTLGAGFYGFVATYSGDANYNGSVGVCEKVTVGKADTTTATAIHAGSNHTTDVQGSSLLQGATIHDQATVSGSGAGTPTGSVSFAFYKNDTCTEAPFATSAAIGLAGGVADAAGFAQGPLSAGGYGFRATYSGDANYKGSVGTCESVTVIPPPSATCKSILAVQGVPITQVTMTASGGTGTGYTFSATGLPTGLSISTGGTISGTPTVSGIFNYTITIKDSAGNIGTVNCSLTVINPSTRLVTKSAPTIVGVGTPQTIVVTETNTGDSPITNVHVNGTGLCTTYTPAILASLAPGASQDFSCTFTAGTGGAWSATAYGTDAYGNQAPLTNETTSGSVTVIHPATVLTTKSVSPGTLVNPSTTVTITVTERNSGDSTISNVFVTGTGCTNWTPASVSSLAVGATQDFSCVFTPTATTNWTATGHGTDVLNNSVPLTNETTSGTVTINSTNVCGLTWGYWKNHVSVWPVTSLVLGNQTYSQTELLNILALAVKGDASINLAHQLIAAKLNVQNGTNYATAGTNIVDADNLLKQFSGKLPYNVASASTVGTQMVAVASNLDDFNSDGRLQPGCTNGSPSVTLTLACSVNTGTVNVNYSYALPVSGGAGPFTFSITGGALPPGLTLNASTGIISGIPTTAGTYSYSAKVVDSKGAMASVSCSITIASPPPAPLSLTCPASSAQVGVFYSAAFTVSGGTAPFTFSLTSGSLPPGMILDTSTGAITGMPTSSGTFSYTGKVVDKKGNYVSKNCSITVATQSSGANVCGLTWGYWKNHTNAWPVATLVLGNQTYVKSELQTILGTAVRGDASIDLAHQLIAAKLNVLNGTKISTAGSNITNADALLAQFSGKLPLNVAVSSTTGQSMTSVASNLDDFNSDGKLQPGCVSTN